MSKPYLDYTPAGLNRPLLELGPIFASKFKHEAFDCCWKKDLDFDGNFYVCTTWLTRAGIRYYWFYAWTLAEMNSLPDDHKKQTIITHFTDAYNALHDCNKMTGLDEIK